MNERYEFAHTMFKENTGKKPCFLRMGGSCFANGCSAFYWFLLILFCLTGGNIRAQGRLEITVKNVSPVCGTVRVALYNRADQFMKKHYMIGEEKVTGTMVTLLFDNLPAGDYAFSIFQDVNDNEELDTNMFGIPREPWGFSNNARGRFGPPDFEAAKFSVNDITVMEIKLNR